MNFPNKIMKGDFLSEQDKSDLLFGIQNGIDYVAASFVSTKEDMVQMRTFLNENGGNDIDVIAKILEAHEQEMTENTRKDIKYAVSYTKQSMNDLDGAVGETKRIVSDLSSRSGIRFPKLSDEYKVRSNSLIANIQGMSDNLGFLNNEMNASNPMPQLQKNGRSLMTP